jgi:acetylornithine/succinyldiaminopimelate/putrescine aminotransferase
MEDLTKITEQTAAVILEAIQGEAGVESRISLTCKLLENAVMKQVLY